MTNSCIFSIYEGYAMLRARTVAALLLFFFFPFSVYSQNDSLLRIAADAPTPGYVVINNILIIGNKVTKSHIIFREVLFRWEDSVPRSELPARLLSTKENLLNTSLFNFVTVDTVPAGKDSTGISRMDILIKVAERWYTWPVPIFEIQERNFNEWWQTRNLNRANYGFYLTRDNFRGRKEELSFYAQLGYTEKYGLSYTIPYLTRQQTNGMGFSFSYSRNREIAYKTESNKLVYFKDPDQYVREEFTGKLNYTYREGIHDRHFLEGKFVQAFVNDTLKNYSSDYFPDNESQIKYFSLSYSYKSDHRDSRQYPLRGYLWEFEVSQLGFGLLKEEKVDVSTLLFTLRGYERLSERFYLSGAMRIKGSPSKDQPYYVQKGLGWRDYVRGYEYYVIDGQSYGTLKGGLKFEIIKPRVQAINIPSLSKFSTFHYALYACVFGDAGYVDDRQYYGNNALANQLIYGYGIGLDYVTYYDVVIRLEYSFNKMMEHGFFLNFDAGI